MARGDGEQLMKLGLGGDTPARPFLKWAGGKGQLLGEIRARLPAELAGGGITRYIEPFVGGGAVMFDLIQAHHPGEVFIADLNGDLTLVYRVIQQAVEPLIGRLREMERVFHPLGQEERQTLFYETRAAFNAAPASHPAGAVALERAAQVIFLNRTCFNGLYRVNAKGGFNVPFGRYAKPVICDAENLRRVAGVLCGVTILTGDFEACEALVTPETFVYFDPPYRPLCQTSSFNAYAGTDFNDDAQHRLAALYRRLDVLGAKLMLSNSDPKNENPDDHFFEDAYAGFHIARVSAKRAINSNAEKRGAVNELIITNYAT